ncbi:YcxB family protein [Pectinatus frisingensis]|uniref:YcxB family protein n=1 Tax=Pectinatus frisingensis TaxID=865 RepID=UPI0018C4EA6A|nr:YcxB family protein [Pectinatus frisingensis]
MNENFITETHFNRKLCREFISYVNLHKQIWLYALLLVLVSILEYRNSHSIERIGLFILAMFLMYFVASYISMLILVKRSGKSLKIRFYEHHMFIETDTKREKIPYNTISKIVERDTCFYLFLKKNKGSFIIEKKGFSKGNVTKFYNFMTDHLSIKAT